MSTIDEKMKKLMTQIDDSFFGNSLKSLEPKTSKAIMNDLNGAPEKYIEFLNQYGVGDLSSFFRIKYELSTPEEIYGSATEEIKDMLIFGSDIGDYLYAFDTKNNWEVVDLDTTGEIFDRYGDFETFMNTILDEIIEVNENNLI